MYEVQLYASFEGWVGTGYLFHTREAAVAYAIKMEVWYGTGARVSPPPETTSLKWQKVGF